MFPGKIGSMVRGMSNALHLNTPQPVNLKPEQQDKVEDVLAAASPNPSHLPTCITFPFFDLPDEILDVFFRCLQIKEIFAFSRVNQRLSILALNILRQRNLTIEQNVSNGIYSVDVIQGNEEYMFPFVIEKEKEKLYFCGNGGEIGIRGLKAGQLLDPLWADENNLMCLALSVKTLCSGDWNGVIRVWDVDTRECKHKLRGPHARACCLVIENGKIYSSFVNREIWAWDIKTGKRLATCKKGQSDFNALAVRDGKLFTSSDGNNIHILDTEKKKWLLTLTGHQNVVSALALVGKKLCSGSFDKTIKVWNADNGDCLATLKGHQLMINSLIEFRGKLCSSSCDNTIKFWNIEKAECLFTLQGHEYAVYPLFGFKDKLYSGSLDHTIRVWDFTAEHGVVLRELAGLLKSGQEGAIKQGIERYVRMPQETKNAIEGSNGESLTPVQLAAAIERYSED